MNKTLPHSRARALEEVGPKHAGVSGLFMKMALSPAAQLIRPISRLAHDGTFNHRETGRQLVR